MLMHYLGDVDKDRQRKLLNFVLSQQNPDGGWWIFRGGPSDINATVKAYFALRLAGFTRTTRASARRAIGSSSSAAWRRATATPSSTWRFSASTTGTACRA
jgi:hypothetical protein